MENAGAINRSNTKQMLGFNLQSLYDSQLLGKIILSSVDEL